MNMGSILKVIYIYRGSILGFFQSTPVTEVATVTFVYVDRTYTLGLREIAVNVIKTIFYVYFFPSNLKQELHHDELFVNVLVLWFIASN